MLDDSIAPIFLNASESAAYLGIGRRSFYELIKRGDFPDGKKLLDKTLYYMKEDLLRWSRNLPYEDRYEPTKPA